MTINTFKKKLQDINPHLDIIFNKNNPDNEVAGITYKGAPLDIGIPSKEVKDDVDFGYQTENGHVHRSANQAIEMVRNKLLVFEENPEQEKELLKFWEEEGFAVQL